MNSRKRWRVNRDPVLRQQRVGWFGISIRSVRSRRTRNIRLARWLLVRRQDIIHRWFVSFEGAAIGQHIIIRTVMVPINHRRFSPSLGLSFFLPWQDLGSTHEPRWIRMRNRACGLDRVITLDRELARSWAIHSIFFEGNICKRPTPISYHDRPEISFSWENSLQE